MDLGEIIKRAKEIRRKYAALEVKKYGREWTRKQIMQGFTHDVEKLKEIIIMSGKGENDQLAHELSDCLWSVLILADKYGIDLEKAFTKTMDEVENRIDSELTENNI